jgi:nucleotide-binding universal stress UspA family protein
MNIVVGVDGSASSQRALQWCAEHAAALNAKVIAIHAVETPVYAWRLDVYAPPVYTNEDLERIEETLRDKWCKPLTDAKVPFEAKVIEGYPANVIIEAAHREKADLVVTGSRGLNGFKEMMLGSTSHHLAHHLARPLVIVP